MPEVELPVGDTTVLVSVRQLDQGVVPVTGAARAVVRAARSLEAVLDGVGAVAQSCVKRFREIDTPPNEVHLELGITLSAEADVVIASTSSEATINVSMTWTNQD